MKQKQEKIMEAHALSGKFGPYIDLNEIETELEIEEAKEKLQEIINQSLVSAPLDVITFYKKCYVPLEEAAQELINKLNK